MSENDKTLVSLPRRISISEAQHFKRDGFSGEKYLGEGEDLGFNCIKVDVHGKHPKKKMVEGTRAYLVIDGTGTFTINGEILEVKPDDLFVIPQGGEYEYQGAMKLFELNVPNSAKSITLEEKQVLPRRGYVMANQ